MQTMHLLVCVSGAIFVVQACLECIAHVHMNPQLSQGSMRPLPNRGGVHVLYLHDSREGQLEHSIDHMASGGIVRTENHPHSVQFTSIPYNNSRARRVGNPPQYPLPLARLASRVLYCADMLRRCFAFFLPPFSICLSYT